jgi:hypothetical protein
MRRQSWKVSRHLIGFFMAEEYRSALQPDYGDMLRLSSM